MRLEQFVIGNGKHKLNINQNNRDEFVKEFCELSKKSDLDSLSKATSLTQALELALLGIDTTKVLRKINQNQCDGQDNTMGYRGEIFASWYLAKFIYDISLENKKDFLHSVNFVPSEEVLRLEENILRSKADAEISYVIQLSSKKKKSREIDVVTDDTLVSVKFKSRNKDRFISQFTDLFFYAISTNKLSEVNKLVIVRRAKFGYEYSPDYIQTAEWKNIKDCLMEEVEKKIFETYKCPEKYRGDFKRMEKEIYFLPDINDITAVKDFIEQMYDWKDIKDSYYLWDEYEKVAMQKLALIQRSA